jgi:hypothetical protein
MPREVRSFEADVGKAVSDWIHHFIPAVAEKLGPLPDTVVPSRDELNDRWTLRSDKVPPGMEIELAKQAAQAILEEHQAQKKPLPDNDTLTKLVAARTNAALYPYRSEVYSRGTPRPEERIKVARQYAKQGAPATPATPTMTPQTHQTEPLVNPQASQPDPNLTPMPPPGVPPEAPETRNLTPETGSAATLGGY